MHRSIQIAVAILCGVLIGRYVGWIQPMVWLGSAALFSLHWKNRGTPWAVFWPLGLAFVLAAASVSLDLSSQLESEDNKYEQLDDRSTETITGEIRGIVQDRPGRVEMLLHTEQAPIWLTLYGEDRRVRDSLLPGQQISVQGRLKRPRNPRGRGAMDQKQMLMAKGAHLLANAPLASVQLGEGHWSWWRLPNSMHQWATAAIASRPGGQSGRHIVAALAVGDRGFMPAPLSQAIRAAGVAHLLAVSGMHLAAVVALVFFVVIRLWALMPWRQYIEPKSVAAGTSLMAALLFTAVTGARASTLRALLVAGLMLVGMMIDRKIRLLHAIAWTASALLLFSPLLLWDPGFQMSFAATFVLAIAFQQEEQDLFFAEKKKGIRLGSLLWQLLRASFWASAATAPIAMHHFGEVAWLGLFTNLLAVPLATLLILPSALAGLLVSLVSETAGALLLDMAIGLSEQVAVACFWLQSKAPMTRVPPLNALEWVLWAVLMALGLWGGRLRMFTRGQRRGVVLLALAALALLGSRLYAGGWQQLSRQSLRVTFVDIGQGDAAVVELPGGGVWLIDGGGLPFVSKGAVGDPQSIAESPARQTLLPYLRSQRIESIDLAILSHPHPDHYIGLQAVAKVMPIKELWSVHEEREVAGAFERWLQELERGATVVRAPRLGLARQQGGVRIEVLWPRYSESEDSSETRESGLDPVLSVNDNSLVVRIDFAGRRLLFAGDLEAEGEALLVAELASELSVDVVKVPHHGSKTSSSPVFVNATHPAVAILSCGRANRFGFPNAGVVARWLARAQFLFRTDQVGSISVVIEANGEMEVETMDPF